MKYKDMKEINHQALQIELCNFKRKYFNLRFQKVLGELNDTSNIKKIKKIIAKIFTALNFLKKTNRKLIK